MRIKYKKTISMKLDFQKQQKFAACVSFLVMALFAFQIK